MKPHCFRVVLRSTLKEGKQGDMDEVCKIIQELDSKSMATGLMESKLKNFGSYPCHSVCKRSEKTMKAYSDQWNTLEALDWMSASGVRHKTELQKSKNRL